MNTLSCVCKRWRTVAEDDYVWRFHVLMRWGIAAVGKNWKQIYRKRHLEEEQRKLTYGPTSLDTALKRAKLYKFDKRKHVSTSEGEKVAETSGAAGFYEMSSLLDTGVKEMYMAAVRACIPPAEKPRKKWYMKLLKK